MALLQKGLPGVGSSRFSRNQYAFRWASTARSCNTRGLAAQCSFGVAYRSSLLKHSCLALLGGLNQFWQRPPAAVASTATVSPTQTAPPSLDVLINQAGAVDGHAVLRRQARAPPIDPPTFVKAPGRIIAIGDLHGDLPKAYKALKLAGVLELSPDGEPLWKGGNTTVVQLGDILDRGDTEIAIYQLLLNLDEQARREGGAVYALNGNHESLNVCGDFRYATRGAFIESAQYYYGPDSPLLHDKDALIKARAALWLPGGDMARILARNPTVLVVNDTAFAHGGLLCIHVQYGLERMNAEVAAWMRRDPATPPLPPLEGDATAANAARQQQPTYMLPPFLAMGNANSVMWHRAQSREDYKNPIEQYNVCRELGQALERIGAKRLVVGHTPQLRGVNCACDGRVWRIDVGMSKGVLNGAVQVIEVNTEQPSGKTYVQVLTDSSSMLDTIDEDALFTL